MGVGELGGDVETEVRIVFHLLISDAHQQPTTCTDRRVKGRTPHDQVWADPLFPSWNPVAGTQPAYGPNPGLCEYKDRVVGDTARDPVLS